MFNARISKVHLLAKKLEKPRPGESRRAQESPGEAGRTQESSGEPSRAQENPGEIGREETRVWPQSGKSYRSANTLPGVALLELSRRVAKFATLSHGVEGSNLNPLKIRRPCVEA